MVHDRSQLQQQRRVRKQTIEADASGNLWMVRIGEARESTQGTRRGGAAREAEKHAQVWEELQRVRRSLQRDVDDLRRRMPVDGDGRRGAAGMAEELDRLERVLAGLQAHLADVDNRVRRLEGPLPSAPSAGGGRGGGGGGWTTPDMRRPAIGSMGPGSRLGTPLEPVQSSGHSSEEEDEEVELAASQWPQGSGGGDEDGRAWPPRPTTPALVDARGGGGGGGGAWSRGGGGGGGFGGSGGLVVVERNRRGSDRSLAGSGGLSGVAEEAEDLVDPAAAAAPSDDDGGGEGGGGYGDDDSESVGTSGDTARRSGLFGGMDSGGFGRGGGSGSGSGGVMKDLVLDEEGSDWD